MADCVSVLVTHTDTCCRQGTVPPRRRSKHSIFVFFKEMYEYHQLPLFIHIRSSHQAKLRARALCIILQFNNRLSPLNTECKISILCVFLASTCFQLVLKIWDVFSLNFKVLIKRYTLDPRSVPSWDKRKGG